ncbi:xanthine permease [Glaciecola sp. KUL10]|uniref:xanthine permease n=1 Tax=Glaciecola sp. (strain KUL10) TaxID=2161813 RepID=UPI000D940754|nr:xanthine permease [Glaciecola sp. KUL10]GBL03795.1 xanthine/uracil/vitamin C permease [Glaciecola sp. KUL10]
MSKQRVDGNVQPGIKWGPFTMRIPFVHLRFSLPDMLQGFAVAGATGLALVPYFMALLGLSFEEAVVMAMIHSLLISFSWMFFGDPYAPGWLTPAIPFVVAFITAPAYLGDHTSQFQAMTALSLNFAFILVILGATGLGAKLIKIVPNVFKGGIILGAAIAAFLRVTKDGDAANVFQSAPIAGTLGVVVCLVFAFSKPLQAIALNKPLLAKILGFGLLPGFIIAGTVGYFTGEFTYNIRWEILDIGAATVSLWEKASPFAIGWPPIETFIASFPLALITYILFFGDVVTGNEMIEHAQAQRSDEKLEIDSSRAHMATGIRNALMGITAPFFATQGVLWTGIQVVLLKRWAEGKDKLNSIYDSIGSFYLFGFPFLFMLLPIVTLLEPLLPVALAVTLILTAFACATLALALVNDATERGAMVITAMAFSLYEPWQGLLIGIFTIIALCGVSAFKPLKQDKNS